MPPTRRFPRNTLEEVLRLSQTIADENAGQPMDRLLLADALDISAGSSNYRVLLSSSRTYGLTEGTEKAKAISLTSVGEQVAQRNSPDRLRALRKAAQTPEVFRLFYERFDHARLPSEGMLPKILVNDFNVAEKDADECAETLLANGRFVDIIRDISGKPHVMLDAPEPEASDEQESLDAAQEEQHEAEEEESASAGTSSATSGGSAADAPPEKGSGPKPIFIGHGRNTAPMEQLERILTRFRVPFKRAMVEPNLGRPIPLKVKETMESCGSAILIFTQDIKLFDEDGNVVWRPSENVVHELGAASFAYGDRIVIFKEEAVTLASNFASIGYIEFSEGSLEAKTADLLQELIGFGLLTVTPAS